MLAKSDLPVHDQRLLDVTLNSSLDMSNLPSIHVESPLNVTDRIWSNGIVAEEQGIQDLFRVIPRGDGAAAGIADLVHEADANSKAYAETYLVKGKVLDEKPHFVFV